MPSKKRAPKKEATAMPILNSLDDPSFVFCNPGETDVVVGGVEAGVGGSVMVRTKGVDESLVARLDIDVEIDAKPLEVE